MSVKCPYCEHEMPKRDNIFGTICDNCKKYIKPAKKPKFVQEAEYRLRMQQKKLRQYLKNLMIGDENGNQVE